MQHIFASLRSTRAFTLIELLIVIAIIAILTVAFLPTLTGGQAKARNAARKAAIADVQTAIGLISEGEIPAGVSLGTAVSGKIPVVTTGTCLDFAVSPSISADIRAVLGKTPAAQGTGVTLCSGGFFYKTFKSDGSPTSLAGDVATNYFLLVEVEGDKSNGNVSGTSITINTATLNGAEFDTWGEVLARTSGASNNNAFIITK